MPARIVFVRFALGAIAAGFTVPLLIPPDAPSTVQPAQTPEPAVTALDLDVSRTVVRRAAGDAIRNGFIEHGTVRFLIGQWGGCDDADATYVQYTVSGRLDQPLYADQPAIYSVAADLLNAGWSDGHNRGSEERPSLLLTWAGVELQLDQGIADPSLLVEFTGPCLRGH